jgi:hypothetical protein
MTPCCGLSSVQSVPLPEGMKSASDSSTIEQQIKRPASSVRLEG